MSFLSNLSSQVKQYLIVTVNYWAFTLTDGALRMLVVLYFHQLGYSPLEIAFLFLFYEFFGVVTNLVGGWLGARIGLNRTMNVGLAIQVGALAMLLVPSSWLTVAWVMVAQALSGIAKDLNKMSAKSAIKLLVKDDNQQGLYKWVAILTGSKNALKGFGFFMGGVLLAVFGFNNAILAMATGLSVIWLFSIFTLQDDLGRAKSKPKFTQIFSKTPAINVLAAARLLLFGARDVWFVVALPVYLIATMDWSTSFVGAFMALWVIGYGIVQANAPLITGAKHDKTPGGLSVAAWALLLCMITLLITFSVFRGINPLYGLLPGLLIFGVVFAINSSVHSYLIVSYADADKVSMDVGFYYMANAAGRLIGTVLSGLLFQQYGLAACLIASALFLLTSSIVALKLPRR